MARTRSIKPGFFDNDVLGDLPPLTRLLFIGLWCIADREGRLEDRPRKIKKAILGYDDVDSDGVDKMLQALQDSGFIIRYEAAGERYIQVINFVKHQNPHMKEKPSEIPPPGTDAPAIHRTPEAREPESQETKEEHKESTRQEPEGHEESQEEAAPITINPLPISETPLPITGTTESEHQEEPRTEKAKSTLESRFELFWKAYPKKKSKKTAWSAFKKIKPDEQLFSRMMEAIGRYRTSQEWQKEGGRYIPYPATWLNGGCWDDEIEEVKDSAKYSGNPDRTAPRSPAAAAPTTRKPHAAAGFKSADEE